VHNGRLRVIDFDTAATLEASADGKLRGLHGTLAYNAPEQLIETYAEKVGIFVESQKKADFLENKKLFLK
jgi:serine/threonine protein kinase